MITRHKPLIVGCAGFTVVLVIVALGFHRRDHYEILRSYRAMRVVAEAAMQYIDRTGHAPAQVRELLDAGLLAVDTSGREINTRPPRWSGASAQAALRITLDYPKDVADYEWRAGRVVHKKTGAEPVLISLDGVWPGEQSRLNRELAKHWFEMEKIPNQDKGGSGQGHTERQDAP